MPPPFIDQRFKTLFIGLLLHIQRHKIRWIVSFLLCLFSAEITFEALYPSLGLRILSQENLWRQNSIDCLRISTEIDYEPIPGKCKRNELGIRVMPLPEGVESAFRILLLGDSVSEGALYVDRMQAGLNADPHPPHWQIWNAGVTGYNLFQEFYLLKKRYPSVQPKLVIFQVSANDLSTGVEIVRLKEEARNLFFRRDGQARYWFNILLNFRLAEYAFFYFYGKPMPIQIRSMHPSMTEVLAEIKEFSSDNHVPILFLVFPYLSSKTDDPWVGTYHRIVENVKSAGMPYYLAERILEQPLEKYRVNPAEGIHPNQEAHRIVGESFLEFLRKESYFQPQGI